MMALYYEQDLNLREIGEVMGVTESRVCQLHTQAIARLRSQFAGEPPKAAKRRRKEKACWIRSALAGYGYWLCWRSSAGRFLEGGHARLAGPADGAC
jgi:hypothetical protein